MTLSKTKARKEFFSLVKSSRNIIITTHLSPDDDAIAASLVTYALLKKKYPSKNINIIITGKPIDRFAMFSGYKKINFVKDLSSEIKDNDMLIMLDGCQYNRFSRHPEVVSNYPTKKICFDHHGSPVDKFDLAYVDKNATSTSEIILDILYRNETISPSIAEIFLMGIFGDTGTFNYLKPSQLNTFDNVKKLMKISKIEIQEFKSRYSKINQKAFTIIQEYIQNTKFINLPKNQSFQYSFITHQSIKKNKYSDGETSEAGNIYMSNYLRLIDGYNWGFIATPKKDEISVSFRSLPGSVNVRRIVEILEIGGGHDRAAGSSFKPDKWGKQLSLDYVLKFIINWISKNKLELS